MLVRDRARLERDLRDPVQVFVGDVRDRAAVRRAVEGVRSVHHLAACARAWARDSDLFRQVNVEGVRNVLEASRDAGVDSLVHVSTILTLPPHREAPPPADGVPPTPYEATKAAGERLVEAYADEGRKAVVVHPTRVYGPGPLNDANGVTRMLALYLDGRFRLRLADAGALANYVHVEDVAEGIDLAGQVGGHGAHYVLGGPDDLTLEALLALAGGLAGTVRRTLAVPPTAALALARLDGLRARLGGSPTLTPGWVRVFLEDRRADVSRARAELGYRPRSVETGLAQTLTWLAHRHASRNGGAP